MSDIITIPTVEQINLEHRLANSKAIEAVQHATNCGLMLLQIKASLNHGEWLPWLKQQQESGAISFSQQTSSKYMRLAANYNRERNLPEATSIRAALELLSDKEPEEQQGSLIDIETERQARAAAEAQAEAERQARKQAEQDRAEWENRQKESQAEANERRKKIRELERQVDLLQTEKPEPEVRIEAPDDYEQLKKTERDLRSDLAELKKQQRELVQQQVAAKLKERESELAEIDQKIKGSEEILAGLQKHIDRYSYQQRELKVHLNAIEEARKALVLLAANLEGFESVIDSDHELRLWRALSQMMRNGADAIDFFVGDSKPALTVIK